MLARRCLCSAAAVPARSRSKLQHANPVCARPSPCRRRRRWLVVAPCLGTEMDEFPCVEVICYPLDDLAHGNAATGSDIVGAVCIRCRQQAHEQVCDIRCINKIPHLPAVGHADRLTCAQCSQQRRNEAPWLVARPIWQKHPRPGGGKAVTLGTGLDDHPDRRFALAIQRSRTDRRCVLPARTGFDVVFGGASHANEALTAVFAERLDQSKTGFQPVEVLVASRYRSGVVTQARCSRWDGRSVAIKLSAARGTCRSTLCQVIPSAES